jgi:predicted Zn-dependent protease
MFRFDELWVHEDIRRAHAELERVSNRPNAQPSDNTIITIRDRYILLGEFKLAQKWTEKIDVHQKYRQSMDASLAYVRGDTAQALKILGLPKQVAADDTWFLYAALAPQNIREVTGPMKQVALNLFQGQSDFLHGRVDEALSRFQTSMDALKDDSAAPMYQATGEMFASALERAGKPQKAVAVLEQVTRVRTTYPGGAAIGLLRNQARLARLYRGLGRETEAAAIEARLRKLLIYADPEHPILKQLHQ